MLMWTVHEFVITTEGRQTVERGREMQKEEGNRSRTQGVFIVGEEGANVMMTNDDQGDQDEKGQGLFC